MFGDDRKKDEDATDKATDDLAAAVHAIDNNTPQTSFAPDPAVAAPAATADATVPAPEPVGTPPDLVPTTEPAPAAPAPESAAEPEIATASEVPASADATLSPPVSTPAKPAPSISTGDAEDLLDIKQSALDQLKPLVDHLDSVPEEKFDALMMMIRASDDQALIQPAYDAAQKIVDDTKRAEALLDVVNEINYLTSNQQ